MQLKGFAMSLLQALPIIAYAGVVMAVLAIASQNTFSPALAWIVPAIVGGLFLAFSLVTIAQDGLAQFWFNHTTNLTGNQVWFDLIFAVSVAFYLIAPRARAVGMALMPWGIAVILSACIALLPMLARLVWLEQRSKKQV